MTVSSEPEAARIPRERLSAWQRWELASLAESTPAERANEGAREAESAALAAAVEAGREQGYREGWALAASEAQRFASILEMLGKDLAVHDQALADEVLDLALMLARKIAGDALAVRRELLLPIVDAALRQLPHAAQRMQIMLHPADVDLVRAHLPDGTAARCELVPCTSMAPGGCSIESELAEVDASLPARWTRLVAAMGRPDDWLRDA